MAPEHAGPDGADCNTIVESLYKDFSLRNEKQLQTQKALTSEDYSGRAFYNSAHIQAIVKVELDYIQRLMDHLLERIETDFPNIPLDNFKQKITAIISQEYDRAIPVLQDFAKGILRGTNTEAYIKPIAEAKLDAMEMLEARCRLSEVKKVKSKNTVFLSHAVEDASVAQAIKTEIDKVFGNGLTVFVSSIPGAISPGADWFNSIRERLLATDAFFVLLTPNSIERQFVWFEIGFSWYRRDNKECEMYALCTPPIDPGRLPEPLCRLQATSLSNEDQTRAFFKKLIEQFGLGNLDTLEFHKIQESLKAYPIESTPEATATETYAGPYAGYSQEALKQVLIDILSQEERYHRDPVTRSDVFSGKLIDYRKIRSTA